MKFITIQNTKIDLHEIAFYTPDIKKSKLGIERTASNLTVGLKSGQVLKFRGGDLENVVSLLNKHSCN